MRLKLLNSISSICQSGLILFSLLVSYVKRCLVCKFNKQQHQQNDILPVTSKRNNKKFTFKYKMKLCYLTLFYNHKNDEINAIETMINP